MKQQPASRQTIIALAALSMLTLATVLLGETTLQIAARIFPRAAMALFPSWFDEEPLTVADSELGIRGNSKFLEHDANGFRNTGIPDRADVIAIGDSQTYGTGVAFDQAWPRQLEKLIRRRRERRDKTPRPWPRPMNCYSIVRSERSRAWSMRR